MVNNRRFNDKDPVLGIRHLQCGLIFFGQAVAYMLRVNMSVAIVAMTDKSTNPEFDEFHWSERTRSFILSSFFWGYVITQVPAGQLAQRYGAKLVLFWGITICSVLAILTPVGARYGGSSLLCTMRVIQGLCQGCLLPSTHTLISKWAPVSERGRLGTISYSGGHFGTALMLCISGELAASVMGWPSTFYFPGGVGIIWAILWYFFSSSSPSESHLISEEEKMYIEMIPSNGSANKQAEKKPKLVTPWKKIWTSGPFYILLFVHCANNWGFWTLLIEIPTYLKNVIGMNIKNSALLSSLPYWVMFLLSYVFLFISEILDKRKAKNLSFSRKFFNTMGHWSQMLGLIGLGFIDGNSPTLAVALLTLSVGMNASCYLGFLINHIDLSPNFAGTLMGITNGIANVMSIFAPITVGIVVTDEKDASQWRIIFFFTAAFFFIGNLMFILFGKCETQTWNEPKVVENKNKTNGQHLLTTEAQQ